MEGSGQLQAPAALPSRKEHPVFIAYEAGWAPTASLETARTISCFCRESNPDCSANHLIAHNTEFKKISLQVPKSEINVPLQINCLLPVIFRMLIKHLHLIWISLQK
jgi:hypothetical protein